MEGSGLESGDWRDGSGTGEVREETEGQRESFSESAFMKKLREGRTALGGDGASPVSARAGSSNAEYASVLLFQGNGVLGDLIEGSDDASVGFVAALRDDEVRELGGNVNVGLFEGAAGDITEYAAGRRADGGLTGGQGWGKIVGAVAVEALHVGEAGERDLADGSGLSVAERSGNGAIGADAEIHQGAAGGAILLDGGGAAGGGRLRNEPVAGCVEDVPGKTKLVGAVGEHSLGGTRGRYRDGGVGGRGGAARRSDTFQGSIALENEGTGGEGNGGGGAGDVGGRKCNGIGPGVDDGGDGGGGIDAVRSGASTPGKVPTRTPCSETGGASHICRDIDYSITSVHCGDMGVEGSTGSITARSAGSGAIRIVIVDGIRQICHGYSRSCADKNVIASGPRGGGGRKGVRLAAHGHGLGVIRVDGGS